MSGWTRLSRMAADMMAPEFNKGLCGLSGGKKEDGRAGCPDRIFHSFGAVKISRSMFLNNVWVVSGQNFRLLQNLEFSYASLNPQKP